MEAEEQSYETGPIFDSFDVDLVVKVLVHTAFSKYLQPECMPVVANCVTQVPSSPSSSPSSTISRALAGRTAS